jgi:hypothetical protein
MIGTPFLALVDPPCGGVILDRDQKFARKGRETISNSPGIRPEHSPSSARRGRPPLDA